MASAFNKTCPIYGSKESCSSTRCKQISNLNQTNKNINFFQPPIVVVIDDDKPVRKSPPESEKESKRDREICLSMAPLPIPLGPLGGFAGNKNLIFFICIFGSYRCTLCIITNFLYAHIFFNKT